MTGLAFRCGADSNAGFYAGSRFLLPAGVLGERAVSENNLLYSVRSVDGMAGIVPIPAICAALGLPLPLGCR